MQGRGEPAPIADASTAWHTVKGGSTLPLKFNVYDAGTGAELVTFLGAVENVRVWSIPECSGPVGSELPYPSLASEDGVLRYEVVAGHFILNWKSPRGGGDACYRATLTTRDGSALHAFIRAR
jgi:hypothetical protein